MGDSPRRPYELYGFKCGFRERRRMTLRKKERKIPSTSMAKRVLAGIR